MTTPSPHLHHGTDVTGENDPASAARTVLRGGMLNAVVVKEFALRTVTAVNAAELVAVLGEITQAISGGNFSQVEAKLYAQACALESIFVEVSQRAARNLGSNMETTERYLRLALKAQNQSRATLETLANIRRPRALFARQANISHGPQQVNNAGGGGPIRASGSRTRKKSASRPNELLEETGRGSSTVDTRAARAAARGNQAVEAVDAVHRARKRPRTG